MLKISGSICLGILIVCGLVHAQRPPSSTHAMPAEVGLARLRSKIDIEPVDVLAMNSIAGHYSSSSDELREKAGPPLSGNDLYLFPDGTYLYCTWSDIPPDTIRDKGSWNVSGGEINLTTDSDVTWNPGTERHYLLVHRRSKTQEVIAVGMDRSLRYFEKHAKDDPEFMLLLVSMIRVSEISLTDSNKLKERLVQEDWRPGFYKPEKVRGSRK
jgi:hypothetical protein